MTPKVVADLHTHTTFSDGKQSPEELIAKAEGLGLTHISITDHDTMQAHRHLESAGYNGSVSIIPGVEISCFDLGREIHLLAYYLDYKNEEIIEYERFFRADRERRAREMVERLQKTRVRISYEEVADSAAGAPIGRPHVAEVLVRRGYVSSIQQAFDVYLDASRPGYAAKSPFPVSKAVEMVHRAGGITSIAHPGRTYSDGQSFLALIATGVDGIEVFHPSHWFVTREYYRVLCEQHGLLITGGSDYHGSRDYDNKNIGVFGVTTEHLDAIQIKTIRIRRGV